MRRCSDEICLQRERERERERAAESDRVNVLSGRMGPVVNIFANILKNNNIKKKDNTSKVSGSPLDIVIFDQETEKI